MEKKMNRIMIFIDAEYAVQKMKEIRGKKRPVRRKDIKWKNLIRWITGRRTLVRCCYYSSEFSKDENPQTFNDQHEYFKNLKIEIPYFQVKLGRLVHVSGGWIQKGVDVKISLDMFSKAVGNQYDTAALVTGDSDFVEVIGEVREHYGKHVELYTFDNSIHEALMLAPDRHAIITSQIGDRFKFWEE